ncbi:MAG TPA: bifunctional phosphopantothenoylcysteine decarboxylase/phosphopantothenate--cysteine ligase CoaBC [Flavobacteriaceae bacterium]|nr:bifunctional phosphopantothenoylcysteine decarboxylase/phosphopantothenate--cysteine ligase CoaBC [Flavobacteriaceae bacterium]
MSVLKGKRILLGITGGIAAYKTPLLVRLLVKEGADVKVVMTEAAKDFVTPLTLNTVSKNPVYSSFTSETENPSENPEWNNHVDLAMNADLLLFAPATANTLAKMAQGECDNLLLAVYLSAACPVYYAPAMDLDMYQHPSVQESFTKLEEFGNIQIPAGFGELASGLIGQGRMAEPVEIVEFLKGDLAAKLPLRGKKVLITAGPTYEAIDPVRFIGNHSSGKMGYALAETAANLGAQVFLISGPTHLKLENSNVHIDRVTSAQEMYDAAHKYFGTVDIAIASAAVADYRPAEIAREKIKKNDDELVLHLTKTKDILASLGAEKKAQFLVGFALETENEEANAKKKLEKKNLDLIVLNSLRDKGAGFQTDTNKVTLIAKDNKVTPFDVKPKEEVAKDIFQYIIENYDA